MIQKYHGRIDDDLVFEYKKTHQEDLENELIARYKKNSKVLAASLFNKFKFLYQVEYDDLYCILLGSLFTAIRGFDIGKVDFYHYWKSSAINEANKYIASFSLSEIQLIDAPVTKRKEHYLRQKVDLSTDDYLFQFELDDILTNEKNGFVKDDVDMFRLYLAGYTIKEIARLTKKTYHCVHFHIKEMKSKIANILFNQ